MLKYRRFQNVIEVFLHIPHAKQKRYQAEKETEQLSSPEIFTKTHYEFFHPIQILVKYFKIQKKTSWIFCRKPPQRFKSNLTLIHIVRVRVKISFNVDFYV